MGNKSELSTSIKSFGGSDEGLSVQGASHIKHDKICQDFGGHFRGDNFAVAVVCDGHGGDAYIRSDRGSRFGVEVTINCVKEFMENKKDVQKETAKEKIEQLIRSIITRWSETVLQDLKQNSFTEEELNVLSDKYRQRYTSEDENDKFSAYGTTLIAVVYAPEFWFGIRIGDGRCVSVSDDGSVCDPIPWDEKCFLNKTTSLCDEKAFENFRYCFFIDNFPAAIYVGTDGIDDSFGTDERLFAFYKRLTETLNQSGFDGGIQELRDYLPKLTARGSGDDVSISGIVDLEKIKKLFTVKEETTEKVHETEMTEENTDENDK